MNEVKCYICEENGKIYLREKETNKMVITEVKSLVEKNSVATILENSIKFNPVMGPLFERYGSDSIIVCGEERSAGDDIVIDSRSEGAKCYFISRDYGFYGYPDFPPYGRIEDFLRYDGPESYAFNWMPENDESHVNCDVGKVSKFWDLEEHITVLFRLLDMDIIRLENGASLIKKDGKWIPIENYKKSNKFIELSVTDFFDLWTCELNPEIVLEKTRRKIFGKIYRMVLKDSRRWCYKIKAITNQTFSREEYERCRMRAVYYEAYRGKINLLLLCKEAENRFPSLEKNCLRFLQSQGYVFGEDYEIQKRFNNLRGKHGFGGMLSYDFALYQNDGVKAFIECQGIQHYREVEAFSKTRPFSDQQESDFEKRKYAKENGVPLIEIPYTEDTYEKVAKVLLDFGIDKKTHIDSPSIRLIE